MGKYIKLFQTHSEYETYIGGGEAILPNVSYCKDNNDVHYNPYVPYADPRLIAKFNVTSTESPTQICYVTSSFSEMEIDGVVQPNVVETYTFDSIGEHTVKYTLSDPTTIGNTALATCVNLIDVKIPQSVTTMGSGVFQGCTSLPVENGIRYADTYLFGVADKTLSSYIIREGTKWSGIGSFLDCTNATSITIPNSLLNIGSNFCKGCTSLTSITIPNSVKSIDATIFRDCSSLESITLLATTAPTIKSSTFRYINEGGTLYVPTGSTGYDVWMGTGNYYLGKYNWTKVEQ